jgi:catechol 2,3-dioxygenase-like lactoylglutathione lyase family enzyme
VTAQPVNESTIEPRRKVTALAITGIVQSVHNLDAALHFYRNLLGFEVLRREQTAAVLEPVGSDQVTLTLHEIGEHAIHGLNEVGPRQLWLAVHRPWELDRIETTLVDAGHQVHRLRWPHADVLRTTDPDNVPLHIVCWSSSQSADRFNQIPTSVYARE